MEFVLGSFHALTLKLPIQISLSVVPELPVSLSSGGKCHKFRKTSTPLIGPLYPQQDIKILFKLSYWSTQWLPVSALLSPSTIID